MPDSRPTLPALSTTVRSGTEEAVVSAWTARSISDPAVILTTSAADPPLTPQAARRLARALEAAADAAEGDA